jgi:hypothetical protein
MEVLQRDELSRRSLDFSSKTMTGGVQDLWDLRNRPSESALAQA